MVRFNASLLAKVPRTPMSLVGYRNQAVGFDPRSGNGARRFGGRFNPPRSFPVIYLCATRPCVLAELTRQAVRQGLVVDDLLPRELWRVTAELSATLDLTDRATLDMLEIDVNGLVHDDVQLTREIGEAAQAQGVQAIRAPSATGIDTVVVVLANNLAGTVLEAELIERWRTTSDFG